MVLDNLYSFIIITIYFLQSSKFAVVFCFKKRKPRLIFKQCNWPNSKTISLCSFHCFVLLVCLHFRVAGLAMNEIVSCWPVNDFVRFHRYVCQNLKAIKNLFKYKRICFSIAVKTSNLEATDLKVTYRILWGHEVIPSSSSSNLQLPSFFVNLWFGDFIFSQLFTTSINSLILNLYLNRVQGTSHPKTFKYTVLLL